MNTDNNQGTNWYLIVEGIDEVVFFKAFLIHLGVSDFQDMQGSQQNAETPPRIINAKGKGNIIIQLKTLIKILSQNKATDTRIGIIIDLDKSSPKEKYNNWKYEILKKCEIQIPDYKNIGTFSEFNDLRKSVGVYISPHPNEGKMLEDLCLATLQQQELQCLDNYLECCGVDQQETDFPKRKLRLYLATYVETDYYNVFHHIRNVAGHWNFEHPNLEQVKKFLISLLS